MARSFILNGDRVVDQRVSEIMESITPSRPSVLDVNERDRHLIARNERIEYGDAERAADILVDLDVAIDTRMNRSTKDTLDSSFELNRLEEQMVELAQRAVDADIDALIDIADELRTLEERLVELDPDREPLPPIEPDMPAKNRRVVGRKSSSTQVQTVDELDDYEPDGEWNIDGIGISAEDLLEDSTVPDYTLVHLGRIYPKNILMGEEE